MEQDGSTERLFGLDRPRGGEERTLVIGDRRIRLAGLDGALARALDGRWGPFLTDAGDDAEPDLTLSVFAAGPAGWLPRWQPGEAYRLEAAEGGARPLVVSYFFCVGAEQRSRAWRVGITDDAEERPERIIENAVRYLCARLAARNGGFAMHAAGVLREGRAYLFAGPSRSGKTTAVGLCAPARSLGDDFAFVVPHEDGWKTAAVPFDNAERIEQPPPPGFLPVAGIWRLYKATETRVEQPRGAPAMVSLMSTVAFPWAVPDLADDLLSAVGRYVAEARFAHLHFGRKAELWTKLLPNL